MAMSEQDACVQIIVSLVFLCLALFMHWRFALDDARYWKARAQRYQAMWDRATWESE